MSPPYRVEREPMPVGSRSQTYRVLVRLPDRRWGTVQTELHRLEADRLLDHLLRNERVKYRRALRDSSIAARTGLGFAS